MHTGGDIPVTWREYDKYGADSRRVPRRLPGARWVCKLPPAAFIEELGAVGFRCIGRNGPRPGDKNYAAYALFKAADKKPVPPKP